jgi:cation diffusion facilitator family transporter
MHPKNKYIAREGWVSIIGNILLFGLKYWAGVVTGSLALIADAWHSLSDTVSSVIVIIGGKVSSKPADKEHPFGHGRAEHIAAVIIGVLLAVVAFDFVLGAVEKLRAHRKTDFGAVAWIAVSISIIAKELMAQYAFYCARKTNSPVLKADGWHHRSDALSSVVIIVGIAVGSSFWWTDGVLSLIVALMIGWASFGILSGEIRSLLGESPSDEIVRAIREELQNKCSQPLHLHQIQMHHYGRHVEMTCHIKLPADMTLEEAHKICSRVEKIIQEKFGIISTVHPEPIEQSA